jgi:hypothetical protein
MHGVVMNKLGVLAFAAKLAPQVLKIRRKTWVLLGLGFAATGLVLAWIAFMLISWLWGHTQTLATNTLSQAPAIMTQAAQSVLSQTSVLAPQAQAQLDQAQAKIDQAKTQLGSLLAVPAAIALQTQDVSGGDVGPVPRLPELMRTRWQQQGAKATVEYQGSASYANVLAHYQQGFKAQGFEQSVNAAEPSSEVHSYRKGIEVIQLTISQLAAGKVNVRLETMPIEQG